MWLRWRRPRGSSIASFPIPLDHARLSPVTSLVRVALRNNTLHHPRCPPRLPYQGRFYLPLRPVPPPGYGEVGVAVTIKQSEQDGGNVIPLPFLQLKVEVRGGAKASASRNADRLPGRDSITRLNERGASENVNVFS